MFVGVSLSTNCRHGIARAGIVAVLTLPGAAVSVASSRDACRQQRYRQARAATFGKVCRFCRGWPVGEAGGDSSQFRSSTLPVKPILREMGLSVRSHC